jgi:hypothetical protein
MTVENLIKDLSELDPQSQIAVGYWTREGIKEQAIEEYECELTDEEADEIVSTVSRYDIFACYDDVTNAIYDFIHKEDPVAVD